MENKENRLTLRELAEKAVQSAPGDVIYFTMNKDEHGEDAQTELAITYVEFADCCCLLINNVGGGTAAAMDITTYFNDYREIVNWLIDYCLEPKQYSEPGTFIVEILDKK